MASQRPFNPEYFRRMADLEDDIEASQPETITNIENSSPDDVVLLVENPLVQSDLDDMYEESIQPGFREKLAQEALQFIIDHGLDN